MNPLAGASDEGYHFDTPEQLGIGYDVAGPGSRGLAALLDLIILLISIVALWALGLVGISYALTPIRHAFGISRGAAEALVLGVVVLLNFVIFWGYFVFFDLVWQGQSPGKRLLGLRVIRTGGYPIDFTASVIRNVVRLVDFLPVYYGVGATVMVIDRYSRRLGDLAAGTLVIKERKDLRLESLSTPAHFGGTTAFAPSRALDLRRLSPEDRGLLREYVARRGTFSPAARDDLSRRLSSAFATKLDYHLDGADEDAFLVYLATAEHQRPASS